jgi:hypothetical protein
VQRAAFGLLVGCVVAGSGCAFGHRHAYHQGTPFVAQRRSMSVALSVQDQRDPTMTGGRTDFVGLSRAGFGNAFPVYTVSGQPLANDFTTSIRRGLEAAGYWVTPVNETDRAPQEILVRTLAETGAERLLIVQIAAWKSDTFMRTKLTYDVMLRVFDARGQELGRTRLADSDVLASEREIERLYVAKLERLLNDYAIKRALGPAPPQSRPPPAAGAPPAAAPPPSP